MKKAIAGALLAAVTLSGAVACAGGQPNRDPRKGWVDIDDGYAYKKCDGTTLVYEINRGGSVVPNSPECAQ